MRGHKQLFSSAHTGGKDDWVTPNSLFNKLDQEFRFTLDPCATKHNTKCVTYFNPEDNGLIQSWKDHTVWINPPYSTAKDWIKKALEEWSSNGTTIVMLLPARTDTHIWHEIIAIHAAQIRFLRGRLTFVGATNSAPFPSALVIFSNTIYKDRVVFVNYK